MCEPFGILRAPGVSGGCEPVAGLLAGSARLLPLVAAFLLGPATHGAQRPAVDFQAQIAPLLREQCLRCHSEDQREGGLSLATAADLREQELVVPGQPDSSHLVDVLISHEGRPPEMPREGRPLDASQVDLVRLWIREGAHWPADVTLRNASKADESWWSLQPLAQSTGQSIDEYLASKLEAEGLAFSPPADRRTLLRRLYFDLHGLPPSPEEVTAFIHDTDPLAYEKRVDRLLGSPEYGERFAQHWLDIAHYADTHGFERDRRRDHAWRYRDYVIDSFNADKPYAQFLREQIAGDVLWPDQPEAVIATGFLAAGPWDYVGQVETKSELLRRAARSLDLDDMVTQVITATIGMTIHCARCHDHKLDPISQRQYYRLRAVFAGVRRSQRLVSEALAQQYEARRVQLQADQDRLMSEMASLEGTGLNLADIVGGGNGLGTGRQRQGIDPRTAQVQTRDLAALGNVQVNQFVPSGFPFVDGVFIPAGNAGQARIPVSSTGLRITGIPSTSRQAWDVIRNGPVASQHSTLLDGMDFAAEGHHLLGLHANAGITFDLQAMRQAHNWHRTVRLTAWLGYFGASGAFHADAWVFADGRKIYHRRALKREDGAVSVDLVLQPDVRFLTLMSTDGGNGYSHDQIGFGDIWLRPEATGQLTPQQENRLAELRQRLRTIRGEIESLGAPPRFYGVVADASVPDVRVLRRGDPESPVGEPLAPGALEALAMLNPHLAKADSSDGERRAALAHWITDPNNPLTYRVIANRLWQWHFGQGLVRTPSDLGYGGDRPSHPELLDWLAAELQRRGGSLKALHRLIVTSRAYRQQSRISLDNKALQQDRDNRWLWRQNPRRLDAETLRDSVLFVSGKLNLERGGPGFEDFDYQDAYAPIYSYVTADQPDLWKRSIYRYVVRTTPNPFLTTFDCPDPANLTASRLTTTTPLQALALYNNEFVLRQTHYLANRIQQDAGSDLRQQVREAFERVFQRVPNSSEWGLAEEVARSHGLFTVCRALLNSNEFLYID